MDRSREGAKGVFDALIGWCQLESAVECFEVIAKFLSKRQGMISYGICRFRHGGQGGRMIRDGLSS